jgi:hypothetical protein
VTVKVPKVSVADMRPVTRRSVLVLAVVGLVMTLGTTPALAHGGDEEADSVDLVEQALAIVVNTPDEVAEALERVEAALAAEAESPSGELDLVALEEAALALEEGRLHDAEDALIQALGRDPHAEETEPPEPVESVEPGATPATTEPTATTTGEEPTEAPTAEEEVVTEHGLTSRVDGGIVTPGPGELVALGVALVLALGGVTLVRGKE